MHLPGKIATHLRSAYTGGNWTSVNVKDTLTGVDWMQAATKVSSFNTIAALVYHLSYYVTAILDVLHGNPLTAKDKFSFDHPPFHSQEDWAAFLRSMFDDAEELASLVEKMPEPNLWETFADEKYGDYYRNLHGLIEHVHYHLGQIVLIKKLLAEKEGAKGS